MTPSLAGPAGTEDLLDDLTERSPLEGTAPQDDEGARRRRRRRRRRSVAVGAVTALAVGGGGTVAVVRAGAAADPPAATDDRAVRTATVTRRDLVEQATVDGTLSYGDTRPVSGAPQGTVTWLPPVGTTVERGQAVARVDERAVVAFAGEIPLYRELAVGVDDGEDVRQLEENLVALGHGIDGLTIDAHFDWATRAAVRNWQQALGVEQTGAVRPGDLVFTAVPFRVAEQRATVGQPAAPGQPLVTVTGTERTVTVKLDAARQSLVNVGDAVQIELPDRRTTGGRIAAVASQAEQDSGNGGSSKPKIPVTITLDDPDAAGRLDQVPVSVRIVEQQATGVLAVPVKALLALSEGGYAVEVIEASDRRYVPVQVGAFAGGFVEVEGAVEAGATVVVAR